MQHPIFYGSLRKMRAFFFGLSEKTGANLENIFEIYASRRKVFVGREVTST